MRRKMLCLLFLLPFSLYVQKANVFAEGVPSATSQVASAQSASITTTNLEPRLDSGNTAWVLMATALVMFMIIPGLGLFYGGLVRRKNVLSVLMQCFIALSIVSILWVVVGYSLAFSPGEIIPGVLGDFRWAFLNGISPQDLSPYAVSDQVNRIPHLVFVMFQGMFAAIAPALIIGAFAERMKFSAFIVLTVVWELVVYIPVAHMVWSSNGWLAKLGALDFAGGTVVHINAGFAALAAALVVGRRHELKAFPPHNLAFTLIGAAMLWFGWCGFNAGSALAANGIAAYALVTTNTAAAVAALVWPLLDSVVHKKPTILGSATGAVAGLVAVTPAAGFVDVAAAMVIGAAASVVCFYMVNIAKARFGYDDTLDAFGCHGVGGVVGALLTGVFANPRIWAGSGGSYAGLLYGNYGQLLIQLLACVVSAALAFGGTVLILCLIKLTIGLRVEQQSEAIGLDISQHHERAYTIID